MRWAPPAAACAVLVLADGTAQAGRNHTGWLYGTDVLPERMVELETWIVELDDVGGPPGDATYLWWAPVIGVTDHLELAIPIELGWYSGGGFLAGGLERYGAEVRWRPQSPDELERGPLATLLRGAVKRIVPDHRAFLLEAGAIASLDRGRIHAVIDAGAVAEVGDVEQQELYLRGGAGVSIEVIEDLRAGAEVFGWLGFSDDDESWLAAGPNLSWTHGRFWLSAALGVGVSNIDAAPRINFGVAL